MRGGFSGDRQMVHESENVDTGQRGNAESVIYVSENSAYDSFMAKQFSRDKHQNSN